MSVCHDAVIPVTAAGGRSGVCGGSIPVHGGVVIDLSEMNLIIEVDEVSGIVTAQCGVFGPRSRTLPPFKAQHHRRAPPAKFRPCRLSAAGLLVGAQANIRLDTERSKRWWSASRPCLPMDRLFTPEATLLGRSALTSITSLSVQRGRLASSHRPRCEPTRRATIRVVPPIRSPHCLTRSKHADLAIRHEAPCGSAAL